MLGKLLPVFYLNDDVAMRSIMSGAYTGSPDGHAVYMKYPLTWLLSLLYRIAGWVPWMEIFFLICIVAGIVLVWRNVRKENPAVGCLTMMALLVLGVPLCFYMHYTLVAAYMAGIGILLYGKEQRKGVSMLFLFLSYLVRSQVFFLAIPFLFVIFLWEGKETLKVYRRAILCVLCAVIVSAGIHALAYNVGAWRGYNRYNDVRTQLYDYTDFLSTGEYVSNPQKYGMTDAQCEVYSSYNLLLDDSINADSMQNLEKEISNYMKERRDEMEYLVSCLKSYYIYIRYDDRNMHLLLLAAYLVLAVDLLAEKAWTKLLLTGCLAGGRSLIWVYLIWQGRFPERVRDSLFYIELLLLIGMWLGSKTSAKRRTVGSICLLLVVSIFGIGHGMETSKNVQAINETQRQWDHLVEYCEEESDRLYLIDVFSSVAYAGRLFEKDAANMQLMGGWLSGSPIASDKMSDAKKVSVVVRSDRTYEWMESYLKEKYGVGEFTATPEEISFDGVSFYVVEFVQNP